MRRNVFLVLSSWRSLHTLACLESSDYNPPTPTSQSLPKHEIPSWTRLRVNPETRHPAIEDLTFGLSFANLLLLCLSSPETGLHLIILGVRLLIVCPTAAQRYIFWGSSQKTL